MKKVTPQEVYEVYRDAIYKSNQEGKLPEGWELPPATWEEVSERGRAIYAQLAWGLKSIEEFKVEPPECDER